MACCWCSRSRRWWCHGFPCRPVPRGRTSRCSTWSPFLRQNLLLNLRYRQRCHPNRHHRPGRMLPMKLRCTLMPGAWKSGSWMALPCWANNPLASAGSPMLLLQGFADLRSQGRLPSASRSHGRAIGAAFSSSAARARSALTCSRSVRGGSEGAPVCARAGAIVSIATMMNFDITRFNTHIIAMHAFHDRPTFHETSDERSP